MSYLIYVFLSQDIRKITVFLLSGNFDWLWYAG